MRRGRRGALTGLVVAVLIAGVSASPAFQAPPFIAASLELFRDVKPGDRIAFGLRETSDALLVVTIERVPARKGR